MDDASDPTQFLVRLPVWLLMAPEIEGQRVDNPFLTTRGPNGEKATPLFTDAQRAKKFQDETPQLGRHVLGAFADPARFLQLLDVFEEKGFTHVALEPSARRSLFFSVAELREAIRNTP